MTAPPMPAGGAVTRLASLVHDERAQLAARARATRWWAATAAALGATAIGIMLLGGGRWFALWRWLPLAWWYVALATGLVAWWRVRRRAAAPAADDVARAIEQERALRGGELRIALESAPLGAFGAQAASRTLARLDGARSTLVPALTATHDARRGWWRRAAIIAGAGCALVSAVWRDGAAAIAFPLAAARGALLPALRIDAPAVALRGARPRVVVHAPERARLTLVLRRAGGAPARLAIPVRDGRATIALPPLDASLTLVADDGRGASAPHALRMAELPYLGDVTAEATYPAYLARAPETLPLAGVLVLPRGTVLRIAARGSVPVRDVVLRAEHGDTLALTGDEHAVTTTLEATRSGRWSWGARADVPLQSMPPAFALDVRADSAPVVEVASTADTLLAASDQLRLDVRAADDHRLARVTIEVRGDGALRASRAILDAPAATFAAEVPLDLAALGVRDAGTVTVQAVAVDASPWAQVGRSRVLVVRRASLDERRAAARAAADSVASSAARLAQQQQQLAQRTGDAARGAARANGDSASMGFDARERAQALAQQQRTLQQQAQQLQQQAKALQEQLRSAGALDSSLMTRLADAQRLMQEALSPQLMERLQQLERGSQRLDADATKQGLAELAKQQEALREQLERNAEMLKRAALEGAMETLRDEASELAKQQRALADSAGRGATRSSEAGRLAQKSERLSRDIEALGKRLRQADAQPGARRAEAARDASRRAASEMQRTAQDPAQAQAASDRAAQAMEQAAEQLSQARQEQVDAWKQETTGELDQSVSEVMQLAEQERQLAQATERQGLDQQAMQRQSSLQAGAQAAAERLKEAGRRSQHVSPAAQRAMQDAVQKLAEATRSAQRAAQREQMQRQQGEAQQGGMPQESTSSGSSSGSQGEPDAQAAPSAGQGAPSPQGAPSSPGSGQQGATSGSQPGGQRSGKRGESSGRPSGSDTPGGASGTSAAGGQQRADAAAAMRDAASALERAASSLVRDRERANRARSASGLPEMLEELAQAARQQQQMNGQAGAMSMLPGGEDGAQAQALAKSLARKQRAMAQRLDDVSGADASGRAEALAEESRRLAEAMERAANDPETARRREEFYQRLLSAGRTLRRDDVDDKQPRESRPGIGAATFVPPAGTARGAPAGPVAPPSWEALRALPDDERRAVLEYFERLNRQPPAAVKP